MGIVGGPFRINRLFKRFLSTIDPQEVEKFRRLSIGWIGTDSTEFSLLKRLNPLRIRYLQHHIPDVKGRRILDVGCGGGLFSLPLARLGANVTGIDVVEENIASARQATHMIQQRENLQLSWKNCPIEFLDTQSTFDVIVASEVLEHVANPDRFVTHCLDLLDPNGGILFITTINSTTISKLLVVDMAEKLLRLVPPGTHNPDRFYSPDRLMSVVHAYQEKTGISVKLREVQGVIYVPFWNRWVFIPSVAANYFAILRKGTNIIKTQ